MKKSTPLVSNQFLLHLDRLIIESGGSPARFVADADLPYETLLGSEVMLPFDRKTQLMSDVENQLNLHPAGLTLAARQYIAHFSPLFSMLSNQYCIYDSLIALDDNLSMVIDGLHSRVETHGELAHFLIDTDLPFLFSNSVFQDHAAGLLVNFLWWLSGSRFKFSKILLPHPSTAYDIRYHAFFGCPVIFESEQLAVCFDKSYLRLPISPSAKFAKKEYSQTSQWNRCADLPAQLREAIRICLLNNTADLADVAEQIGMSKRTLQRRLKEVDTCYQWQLDSVRAGQARNLLVKYDYSIARISAMLAYADQGTFSRSFQRWYGTSPQNWRRLSCAEGCSTKDGSDNRHRDKDRDNKVRSAA